MVNIIVSSDTRYPIDRSAIQATVVEVLQRYKIKGRVEIGVNIIGDRKMHEVNKKYRGVDDTANILTFALEDPQAANLKLVRGMGFVASPDKVLRLGDILISYAQAKEDAMAEGVPVDQEISFLVEHGMKHLLGMHHE